MKKNNTKKTIFAYSTLGIQLAAFMVLFVYGGYKLDNHLSTSPLFVALGGLFGMGAGIYTLVKGMSEMDNYSKKEKSSEDKKSKWL